jgi:hypothetical protein
MPVLHLGVIDQMYRTPGPGWRGRRGKGRRRRRAQIGARTTFEVATILEHRYGVMRHFFEAHTEEIGQMIADAYAGSLETSLMRHDATQESALRLVGTGMGKVKTLFNTFLDREEMAKLGVPGVPTQAALHGVSHRFKHPYARRGRRPSFIDTGLYESSFMAWVD